MGMADKANDLKNPRHLWKRHAAGAKKCGNKTADDNADKSAANCRDEEKQQPCF
jgi:hypothetical protein